MKTFSLLFLSFTLSLFIIVQPIYSENFFTVSSREKKIPLTGYARCSKSFRLTSDVAGKILKINYQVGNTITDQNYFIEIDPTLTQQEINKNNLKLKHVDNRIKFLQSKINGLKQNRELKEAIQNLQILRFEKEMIDLSLSQYKKNPVSVGSEVKESKRQLKQLEKLIQSRELEVKKTKEGQEKEEAIQDLELLKSEKKAINLSLSKLESNPVLVDFEIEKNKLRLKLVDSRIQSLESAINHLKKGQKLAEALKEMKVLKSEKEIFNLSKSQLNAKLDQYKITSAAGGIVTECMVKEGEYIVPGTPLASVADYSKLVVPLSLSREEVDAVKNLPEKFKATLDGVPVNASISSIDPKFDEKNRKIKIELSIENIGGKQHGGSNFSSFISVKTDEIMIPRAAVKNRFSNPSVVLERNREPVPVMILGESGNNLIGAKSNKLVPGTRLLPASSAN